MNFKHLLCIFFILSLIAGSQNLAFAQEDAEATTEKQKKEEAATAEPDTSKKKKRVRPPYVSSKWPSISAGAGTMSLLGDMAPNLNPFAYTNFRFGYNFRIEHRTWSALGFALNGLYGEVAEHERSLERNINVQSTIMQGELDVMLYLDNNLFINRASRFSPYLFSGVGYMMFEPKADMLDKTNNNQPYYYWDDGTIRTQPKDEQTIGNIDPESEDYNLTTWDGDYETTLEESYDDSATYDKQTITIPIGLGLRYKLSDKFHVDFTATYYLTQTDYLDNLKGDGLTDAFLYTSLSLKYNIGIKTPDPEPTIYDDVDFEALDTGDDDGDGVINIEDRCAQTPGGVPVNEEGCPLDGDNDGVPDYKDEEPNSAEGAIVDAQGITIGEESFDDLGEDTLGTPRNIVKDAYPSSMPVEVGTYYKEQEKGGPSGAAALGDFKAVDMNNDGYISADEISNAIDMFFEGELDYSAAKLHELIDFFFEQ